jgi:hypothetical protein
MVSVGYRESVEKSSAPVRATPEAPSTRRAWSIPLSFMLLATPLSLSSANAVYKVSAGLKKKNAIVMTLAEALKIPQPGGYLVISKVGKSRECGSSFIPAVASPTLYSPRQPGLRVSERLAARSIRDEINRSLYAP